MLTSDDSVPPIQRSLSLNAHYQALLKDLNTLLMNSYSPRYNHRAASKGEKRGEEKGNYTLTLYSDLDGLLESSPMDFVLRVSTTTYRCHYYIKRPINTIDFKSRFPHGHSRIVSWLVHKTTLIRIWLLSKQPLLSRIATYNV